MCNLLVGCWVFRVQPPPPCWARKWLSRRAHCIQSTVKGTHTNTCSVCMYSAPQGTLQQHVCHTYTSTSMHGSLWEFIGPEMRICSSDPEAEAQRASLSTSMQVFLWNIVDWEPVGQGLWYFWVSLTVVICFFSWPAFKLAKNPLYKSCSWVSCEFNFKTVKVSWFKSLREDIKWKGKILSSNISFHGHFSLFKLKAGANWLLLNI